MVKGITLLKRKMSEHEAKPFLPRSLSPSLSSTHTTKTASLRLQCWLTPMHPARDSGFVLNLIFAIWGSVARLEREEGLVRVQEGHLQLDEKGKQRAAYRCQYTCLTLLGASSYIMQRLAAPTSDDVDETYQKYKSVPIGSLSSDSFSYMSKRNLIIFLIL